jgi:hypothetical protein
MLLDAMMMEARKGLMERERDQFPIGMRVLAVDDDPVCLKVLEGLLRHCQYHGQNLLTCTSFHCVFCLRNFFYRSS